MQKSNLKPFDFWRQNQQLTLHEIKPFFGAKIQIRNIWILAPKYLKGWLEKEQLLKYLWFNFFVQAWVFLEGL